MIYIPTVKSRYNGSQGTNKFYVLLPDCVIAKRTILDYLLCYLFLLKLLKTKGKSLMHSNLQSNEKHFRNARILLTINANGWAEALSFLFSFPHSLLPSSSPFSFPPSLNTYHYKCAFPHLSTRASKMDHKWDEETNEVASPV